jgi:photosystem II stability/assembly factor-like uncharacterized protein
MFSHPRFGNTTGLDFAEAAPELVARVGTGDAGHGALSEDGGKTFYPFASEPSGAGAGTIALSSDGSVLIWSPEGGVPARSEDRGESWSACDGIPSGARVSSDRVDSSSFYGIGDRGVYVSTDGGKHFELTKFPFARGARLRTVFGQQGHFWVSSSTGLYRSTDAGATITRVESIGAALAVGFGRAAPDSDYPTIYLSGSVNERPGIYRSEDSGSSWTLISDDRQNFGWINLITGDQRSFGRVYLGTSGRGIVYGDPL